MKKPLPITSLFLICVIVLTSCSTDIEPNGMIAYNHVSVLDEGEMYIASGWVDNIFVGKVIKKVSNNPNDGFPKTVYKVEVLENLKGDLVKDIELTYHGGYLKNGTLVLNRGDILIDDGLPEINETYIFSTFSQPEGSLLVADLTGKKLYRDKARAEFVDYIANQAEIDRQRFESIYDNK